MKGGACIPWCVFIGSMADGQAPCGNRQNIVAYMSRAKKPPRMNAMKLAIQEMESRGYTVFKTEWHVYGRSHDLFGFADCIALGQDEVVAVQATSRSNISARVKKIVEHENLAAVRKAGIRIIVLGFALSKDLSWVCTEKDLS